MVDTNNRQVCIAYAYLSSRLTKPRMDDAIQRHFDLDGIKLTQIVVFGSKVSLGGSWRATTDLINNNPIDIDGSDIVPSSCSSCIKLHGEQKRFLPVILHQAACCTHLQQFIICQSSWQKLRFDFSVHEIKAIHR